MITFFWIKSEDNQFSWQIIPGATGREYDPGPIYVTTHYRRCAMIAGCNTIIESNIVVKSVGDEVPADITGPDPAIVCVGEIANYSTTRIPGAIYSWNFGEGATPQFANTYSVAVSWSIVGSTTITLSVTTGTCAANNIQDVFISNDPYRCGSSSFTSDPSGTLQQESSNAQQFNLQTSISGF